ncbi:endodeoxyribonuclease RUS [uncultured Caudovirales phage]|uniref:Crossover junction endodeoxyribonuclease RusA n=1 Tax=uncultured Caudovirales phage TaxID=2100421 RepID=A0A6J5LBH8_9CAUD|nr:endodeoxyribonuclease RUS [uncultured Caudovirales phage]
MWKHAAGRHYLTQVAADYYASVKQCVREQGKILNLDMPINVHCVLSPPDLRRRDMDNAWKVLADSLTKSMVWQDDSQIRKLTLEWDGVIKGGLARVSITQRVEETVS